MGGGGKSGGGSSSTTVQKADPWKAQRPYLKEMFKQSQKLYKSGELAPAYYSGQTVAGMDPATSAALDMQEQRALAGNAGMLSAQAQLSDTMSGKYLNSTPFSADAQNPFADAANPFAGADNPFANTSGNPQLEAMVQRAIGQSNAGVNSGFAGTGRYGSGAHAAAMNDAAGNIATRMYGQAYDQDMNRNLEAWNANMNREYGAWDANRGREYGAWDAGQNRALSAWNTERDNQIKGMMFAPQLAQADYQDIASLSEVGTARENYAQELLNADIDKYNYEASRPSTALQNYANLIQGNYGMSGSSTSSGSAGRGNPLGGVVSGGALGAGLGLMSGGTINPWVSAGVGGLLGLFG